MSGVCGGDHRIAIISVRDVVWFGRAIWSVLADLVPGLDPWNAGLVVRFGAILLLGTVLGASS